MCSKIKGELRKIGVHLLMFDFEMLFANFFCFGFSLQNRDEFYVIQPDKLLLTEPQIHTFDSFSSINISSLVKLVIIQK